jgi:hypothetical protein
MQGEIMNLTRYDIAGWVLFGLTMAMLLSACESTRAAANPTGISDQKIGNICAETLSYDVTGPYYANCRNYLRKHSQAEFVPVNDPSEPAEHRACREIGLAKDTAEYKGCVQELSLLDISAAHL